VRIAGRQDAIPAEAVNWQSVVITSLLSEAEGAPGFAFPACGF